MATANPGWMSTYDELSEITTYLMVILGRLQRVASIRHVKEVLRTTDAERENMSLFKLSKTPEQIAIVLDRFIRYPTSAFSVFTHNDEEFVKLGREYNFLYGRLVYAIIKNPEERDLFKKKDGSKYNVSEGGAEFVYYHYARITWTVLQIIRILGEAFQVSGRQYKLAMGDLYNVCSSKFTEASRKILYFCSGGTGSLEFGLKKFLDYFNRVFTKQECFILMNWAEYDLLKTATEMDVAWTFLELSATSNKFLPDMISHLSDLLKSANIIPNFELCKRGIREILLNDPNFFIADDTVFNVKTLRPDALLTHQSKIELKELCTSIDCTFQEHLGRNLSVHIDECVEILLRAPQLPLRALLMKMHRADLKGLIAARLYSRSDLFRFNNCCFSRLELNDWNWVYLNSKILPVEVPAADLVMDHFSKLMYRGKADGQLVMIGLYSAIVRLTSIEDENHPSLYCFCNTDKTSNICMFQMLNVNNNYVLEEEVTVNFTVSQLREPHRPLYCLAHDIVPKAYEESMKQTLVFPIQLE